MNFTQAINGTIPLSLGGSEYPVRPLKFREWAPLQAWIIGHVPSPLARVARTLAELKDAGTPADEATEDLLLDHAHKECLSWPPRVGSETWIEALDGAEGGLAELTRIALAAGGTIVEGAKLSQLVEAMTPIEVLSLVHLAVYGIGVKKDEPTQAQEPNPKPESIPVAAAVAGDGGWGAWRT